MWSVPLTRGLISLIPTVRRIRTSQTEADRPHGFCVQAVGFVEGSWQKHWHEKWADTALHGHRRGRRAGVVWMHLSLSVKSALVNGSDLMGMSIDWNVTFQVAWMQGIHPRVLQPVCGRYRELRRWFVMAGHVGRKFAASNSQWCARVTKQELNVEKPKDGAPRKQHCNQQDVSEDQVTRNSAQVKTGSGKASLTVSRRIQRAPWQAKASFSAGGYTLASDLNWCQFVRQWIETFLLIR